MQKRRQAIRTPKWNAPNPITLSQNSEDRGARAIHMNRSSHFLRFAFHELDFFRGERVESIDQRVDLPFQRAHVRRCV